MNRKYRFWFYLRRLSWEPDIAGTVGWITTQQCPQQRLKGPVAWRCYTGSSSCPESLTLGRTWTRSVCPNHRVLLIYCTLLTPVGVLDTEQDLSVPPHTCWGCAHQEGSSVSPSHVLFSPGASGVSVNSALRPPIVLHFPIFISRPTEGERTERLIKAKLRSIMMSQDLENVTSKEVRKFFSS